MKTELIASWNLAEVSGREMYIITTVNGNTIWVNKSKFDTNAETITFKPMVAGDTYTAKDGTIGKLTKDRNEFIGAGKQIVKKYSSVELMDHLVSKGITPSFALN